MHPILCNDRLKWRDQGRLLPDSLKHDFRGPIPQPHQLPQVRPLNRRSDRPLSVAVSLRCGVRSLFVTVKRF